MQYRPDIDGLRALAVMPVLFFHAGMETFKGGFLGVDVFFVISGYLIGTILIRDLAAGRMSILRFYERRARRILPALFFVMIVTTILALFWLPPREFRDYAESLIATSLFGSNILFWKETGYFEAAAETKPLLHTWSLAVEEQYYLLFPVALGFLWKFGYRRLVAVIAGAALLSLLLGEWVSRVDPAAAFYLSPFRFWELLAGALAALFAHKSKPSPSEWLSALGLVAVVAAIFLYDGETTRTPSLLTVIPVASAVAVIYFGGPGTRTGRILSIGPLVWIGLISYSLYLWHQPLFAFARVRSHFEPAPELMLALIALSILLAWATWAWVERPFRYGHGRAPLLAHRKEVFTAALVGIAAFCAMGAYGDFTNGREVAWRNSVRAEDRALVNSIDFAERRQKEIAETPFDNGDCVFGARTIDEALINRLEECKAKHGPALVVLGDSHAIDLYGMVRVSEAGTRDFIVGLTSGGCRPHEPLPNCMYAPFLELVRERPDLVDLVLFHQAGFYLLEQADGSPVSRDDFHVGFDLDLPTMLPAPAPAASVAKYLEELSKSAQVVWVGPRLELHMPLFFLRKEGCEAEFSLRPNQVEIFERLDETLRDYSTEIDVEYFSLMDALALKLPEDLHSFDEVYWADGDHFSEAGESRFGERLKQSGALLDVGGEG